MESNEWCRIYGRQHGTAFYFTQEDCLSFLSYMKSRFKNNRYVLYLEGFKEGLEGKFRVQYRYMKDSKGAVGRF